MASRISRTAAAMRSLSTTHLSAGAAVPVVGRGLLKACALPHSGNKTALGGRDRVGGREADHEQGLALTVYQRPLPGVKEEGAIVDFTQPGGRMEGRRERHILLDGSGVSWQHGSPYGYQTSSAGRFCEHDPRG
jgi:hypothetical protein